MDKEPVIDNVVYLDEYRKARWLSELNRSRRTGQVALFGHELLEPAQLLLFPVTSEGEPDGVA